jgi:hypothetical protein
MKTILTLFLALLFILPAEAGRRKKVEYKTIVVDLGDISGALAAYYVSGRLLNGSKSIYPYVECEDTEGRLYNVPLADLATVDSVDGKRSKGFQGNLAYSDNEAAMAKAWLAAVEGKKTYIRFEAVQTFWTKKTGSKKWAINFVFKVSSSQKIYYYRNKFVGRILIDGTSSPESWAYGGTMQGAFMRAGDGLAPFHYIGAWQVPELTLKVGDKTTVSPPIVSKHNIMGTIIDFGDPSSFVLPLKGSAIPESNVWPLPVNDPTRLPPFAPMGISEKN